MITPPTTSPEVASDSTSPPRHGQLAPLAWSLLAAVPFLLFPLIHFERWASEATGFTTYDLPYYVANARAILDRGHAGLYPNPFDPDPAAPVIYVHWLMNVLATLIGPLGLSPGHALLLIQAIGAIASARVMYALVAWLLPASRWRTPLYLLTMWSGGVLVLGRLVANLFTGLAWNTNLLAFDPGQGLWCLNFGRNLILPTEAIYHALMLALWLSILKGQWTRAAFFLLAITTTHPFTGAQALAIVGAYGGVQAFASLTSPPPPTRRRATREGEAPAEPHTPPASASTPGLPPLSFIITYFFIAAAFVAYYFVFLPRFPQHREIQHTWTLGWTLSGPTILVAYAPVALLAWLAIRDNSAWRRHVRFLLIAAGVSFLLANHQWFITPRQPIHFTRGYIWTPLFLIGLPTLASLFDRLFNTAPTPLPSGERAGVRGDRSNTPPKAIGFLAIALLFALALSDNAAFLLINATSPTPPGFNLTADEQAVFHDLNTKHLTGVLLTDDDRLGYLAAAMTSARPWLGHKYNTPKFDDRQTRLAAFKSTTAAGDLLEEVDLALTADPRVTRRLHDNDWQKLSTQGDLQLWQKPQHNPTP
ncbi:hypothetical protein Pan44_40650 [Caulifigura coniformis]|uniref:Uncharacterized protein n=1 Tax=Caulifigura coniformis TaxID=2527983 RepID=A0A517SIU8_9PLAN|nr:hypothetical protein [Caulifigura coniformis]QDT56016.1 hypothetical protein Pan44_40650 [Caulifigura coniformis]